MKILGVKFKNINSLAGEWDLSFDRSPIADTGLFAIVGPNGSGKSSILDAITLGLYGETPRLKHPEADRPLRETESYAEVTFAVKDAQYCSRWSVFSGRENPQPPDMCLFSLNGEKSILEDRIIPVRNRVAELTGLDFKRFCCSILLAQGEFAAFLNALESERAEILEKIIGTEVIGEMESAVRTRAEQETDRLHRLKEEAAGFQTPPKVRTDDARQSLEQARVALQEIGRELERLREMEAWRVRLDGQPMAEQQATEALEAAKSRCAALRRDLEALDKLRSAGLLKETLAQFESLKAGADSARGESRLIAERIPRLEAQSAELAARMEGIHSDLEAARERRKTKMEEIDAAARMDRDIAVTGERFLETVSRLEAATAEQQEMKRRQAGQDEKEGSLAGRLQEVRQWLSDNAGDAGLVDELPGMEQLLDRLAAVRLDLEACRNLRADAVKDEGRSDKALRDAETAVQKIRVKVERLLNQKADRDGRLEAVYAGETKESLKTGIARGLQTLAACKALRRIGRKARPFRNVLSEHSEIRTRIETLTEAVSREQGRLDALSDQIRHRDTVRSLDSFRASLQPGQPCPLCGASSHPFLENGGLDFSELDLIVRDRQEKIRTLNQELEALQKKDQSLQRRVDGLETLTQAWTGRCDAAGKAWAFGDMGGLLEEIRIVRSRIRDFRSRNRTAGWVAWQASRTLRRLEKKQAKLSKREAVLAALQDQQDTRQKALARADEDIRRLTGSEESVRAELAGRLQSWQEMLPEPGGESLPVGRLKERWDRYRRHVREQEAAAEELEGVRAQRLSLQNVLQELAEDLQELSAESEAAQARLTALQADRSARFGTLDPENERRSLENAVGALQNQEQSLAADGEALQLNLIRDRQAWQRQQEQERQLRSQADALEKEFLEKSEAAGFSSLNAVREALFRLESEPELRSRIAAAETEVLEGREALAALRPKYPTDDTLDTIRWKISDAVKRQKELETDMAGHDRFLEQARQAEEGYRDLLQAISVQEKIAAEAEADRQGLEGQEEGGGKYHHRLLRQLLEETNRHLAGLSSGRYSLMPSTENAMGLHVEDLLQAGGLRSVKTLSGGESFLVSLCLALGLSDMAGRHRKIESLFIDEGFGVLDDETLYKVMSALKNLRANGKTVGIISHVKRLADEIPTQIRLEKDLGGTSRITVVA